MKIIDKLLGRPPKPRRLSRYEAFVPPDVRARAEAVGAPRPNSFIPSMTTKPSIAELVENGLWPMSEANFHRWYGTTAQYPGEHFRLPKKVATIW